MDIFAEPAGFSAVMDLRLSTSSILSVALLEKPPLNVTPNLSDPESRAWQVYVTAAVCGLLVFLFSAMQMCTKLLIQKRTTFGDCRSPTYSLVSMAVPDYI